MKTLLEIEAEVQRLSVRCGAGSGILPTYGRTEDGARPHIEVDAREYHFVVVERGQELRRDTTGELDQLLYWVFDSVTFSLACAHELRHRVPGQDSRRLLFAWQVGLLAKLSPAWAARKAEAHERILRQNPFRDR